MTGYTGVEELEAMAFAKNYNAFLARRILAAMAPLQIQNPRVVDFGAGTGLFAAEVRRHRAGAEIVCVDSDPVLREHCAAAGFMVMADLDGIAEGSVDFIYSLNVLEHIEDDAAVLRAFYAKLKPGGRLFLYVPAMMAIWCAMDAKVGHFRRYSRKELAGKVSGAGFSVASCEFADSLGVAATLAYKLMGSRQGNLSARSVALYDRFGFPLSRLLDRLGFSRLMGKNLMMAAVKPGL